MAEGTQVGSTIIRNLEPGIPSKSETDEELVARARAGNPAAFEDLLTRHQDRVFNMALRMLGHREDALDVAQEVFVTVFKSLRRFESRARFSTWLYRVTVNRCRDELRRRASRKHARPRSLDVEAPEAPAAGPAPPEAASAGEMRALVETAIRELPTDSREVLVLRDVEGLSYEEIAAVLEIPLGTVRSRLNRARSLLRERLRPMLEMEP